MFFSVAALTVYAFHFLSVSAFPSRKRQLATVISSCTVPNTAALTFDDGPFVNLKTISDLLTNAGAKGTFFFNGNNFDCIYSADSINRVKYAFNAGHMIGDHTWSHADLTTLSSAQISDGMFRMEEAFSRIIGVIPKFTRPPFGSLNDNVRQVAASRGQTLALWDQDTGDADGASVAESKAVYQNAVNARVNNMLVLNHETVDTTASQVIPFAINLLQSNGYRLVTLAECLGMQPYARVGVPQNPSAAWTCNGTPGPGEACSGSQCQTGTPTLSTAPTGPTGTPPPTQSNLVIHPGASTTKCLTPASNTDGAAVEIEDCDGSASQSWTLSGFNIQIFGNKCLDVTGGSTANGNKMQIFTCSTNNPNQLWTVGSGGVGRGTLQWQGTGECLDDTDGSLTNGNVVQMWQCTGGPNQQWVIATGGGGTTPPPPGGHVIHPGASATTCLTAPTNADGGTVVIQPCNGAASQQWTQSGGTLVIYNNKCLDVTNGSTANGNKMQIWTCSGGNANQQFTATADNRIAWTNKGECLDLTGGSLANGNPIQMWACTNGNNNQVWNII